MIGNSIAAEAVPLRWKVKADTTGVVKPTVAIPSSHGRRSSTQMFGEMMQEQAGIGHDADCL